MANPPHQLDHLLQKMNELVQKHHSFSEEIEQLRKQIQSLQQAEEPKDEAVVPEEIPEPVFVEEAINPPPIPVETPIATTVNAPPSIKSDLEKFIGENLINKIGIAITVLGVAIGTKYSIEHDLISPVTRILLGYVVGFALLGIGFRLKKKYSSYSAVLVSGSIAILYFLTYSAYAFYGLIPQIVTFVLMVLFTVFAVAVAINYNRPIIAHIGLVGAYAVPFLLSDGSGRVEVLFAYMAIINTGILFISFRRYWKSLYYSSFGLSWLIYFAWYTSEYIHSTHFAIGLLFLCVFFTIFYLTFLAYKLLRKETFEMADVVLLLINSFLFYGIGYSIYGQESGQHYPGLFTVANALLHGIVSVVVWKRKEADKNLFYLISGLSLVFFTLAIPVQLDGNWVTLLWAGEAAVLFWIGRSKGVYFYEKLSYGLMLLAALSIGHDWVTVYKSYSPRYPETAITPLLNIHFLTSLLFIAAFGFMQYVNQNKNYPAPILKKNALSEMVALAIPVILIGAVYFSLRIEIATYWNQLYLDSSFSSGDGIYSPGQSGDMIFRYFRTIWLINYSLLFFTGLAFVNLKKVRNEMLGMVSTGFVIFSIAVFLFQGLVVLGDLRDGYIRETLTEQTPGNAFYIGIRYVSFLCVALALWVFSRYKNAHYRKYDLRLIFDLVVHISALWILSSEMILWLKIGGSPHVYKLGLSILWGVYSLFLIALGIWKKKKSLRVGAIVLFGATLLKLFFYDITHLETIAKTILFVSLGVLLLIISFLYNKYKHFMVDEK